MYRLDNWSVTPLHSFDPYQPPECQAKGLHGKVYGNPKFEDGDEITTSRIVSLNTDGGRVFVTTVTGSTYELGEVDPGYEKLYPLARERMVKSFFPTAEASLAVLNRCEPCRWAGKLCDGTCGVRVDVKGGA